MTAVRQPAPRPSVVGSGDPLDGIRGEDANPTLTFGGLNGFDVGRAINAVRPAMGGLGWQEAVERLREGIVVEHECLPSETRNLPGNQRHQHYLHLHPDGTISLLNHPREGHPAIVDAAQAQHREEARLNNPLTRPPAPPAPPSGSAVPESVEEVKARQEAERLAEQSRRESELHAAFDAALATVQTSETLDLPSLLTLHALGAPIPGCMRVALWLTRAQSDPTGIGARLDETFQLTSTNPARWRNRNLPILYAAVAWAQRPVWPNGAGERYLTSGITPRILRAWLDAGWDMPTAIEWLNRGARLDVAEPWRLAGDLSVRAAKLAALGELPGVSEQPWLDAGFAPAESDQWRARKEYGRIPRLSPEDAFEWHRHGVRPNSVYDFNALPRTNEDAAQKTEEWRKKRSALRKDGTPYPGTIPTLARALEWTAAGVPSELVLAWCRSLGADDDILALAVQWGRIIPAQQYATIEAWNTGHPTSPLQPADVARLRRIGLATDGDNMGRLTTLGVSNNDILRPVQMLTSGKRWLGRSLREHLLEQADAHAVLVGAGATDPTVWGRTWGKNARLPAEIVEGKWNLVVRALKGLWSSENIATWRHVIDWLETNPTPPPPYSSGYLPPATPNT